MPQLDIYTFSTQIYLMAIFTFSCLILFSYFFIYILFFESEVYEKDEVLLETMHLITKYELSVLQARTTFLSYRLAEIYILFFRF